MSRPSKTINTAMLATAIGIDARFESDIRALIARDDCLRVVAKILRHSPRLFVFFRIGVDNIDIGKIDMELFETIGRTPGRPAANDRLTALWRLVDDRSEPLLFHRSWNKFA